MIDEETVDFIEELIARRVAEQVGLSAPPLDLDDQRLFAAWLERMMIDATPEFDGTTTLRLYDQYTGYSKQFNLRLR